MLSIGQDVGAPGDEPLHYAERDAARMVQLFTSMGDVARDRVYLVTNASAEGVRQAIAEIRGRSLELKDVVFIIYVSSHAQDSVLHLGSSTLPLSELNALVASVPARVRLTIVDACTAGGMIRQKGGKPVTPFAIDFERAQAVQGQVTITSAGAGEPAQEWEALGGSLFTHHWLSALRGAADRNADGRVSLFEAYSYAYDHTLSASSGASAGLQHAFHEFDLSGAGDFVLTRPSSRASGIELSAELAGRYIVSAAMSGELIAELDKAAGRPLRLALDPGRYLVRKPEGSFVRVGQVDVLPYQLMTITDDRLQRVPYMEVARRGAGPTPSWSLEARAGLLTSSVAGKGVGPRFGVGLGHERGPLAFGVALEAGLQHFDASTLHVKQRDLWAGAELRRRWASRWLLPFVGARVGAGFVHQSSRREREAELHATYMKGVPNRMGAAAEAFGLAGLELPLRALVIRPQLGVGLFVSRTSAIQVLPAGLARVDVGFRF